MNPRSKVNTENGEDMGRREQNEEGTEEGRDVIDGFVIEDSEREKHRPGSHGLYNAWEHGLSNTRH